VAHRYAYLCTLLFRAHGINIDEYGNLDPPPKYSKAGDVDESILRKLRKVDSPTTHDPDRWSVQEDTALLKAYLLVGTMWATIRKFVLPHRERSEIRRRFMQLERRIKTVTQAALKQKKKRRSYDVAVPASSNNNEPISASVRCRVPIHSSGAMTEVAEAAPSGTGTERSDSTRTADVVKQFQQREGHPTASIAEASSQQPKAKPSSSEAAEPPPHTVNGAAVQGTGEAGQTSVSEKSSQQANHRWASHADDNSTRPLIEELLESDKDGNISQEDEENLLGRDGENSSRAGFEKLLGTLNESSSRDAFENLLGPEGDDSSRVAFEKLLRDDSTTGDSKMSSQLQQTWKHRKASLPRQFPSGIWDGSNMTHDSAFARMNMEEDPSGLSVLNSASSNNGCPDVHDDRSVGPEPRHGDPGGDSSVSFLAGVLRRAEVPGTDKIPRDQGETAAMGPPQRRNQQPHKDGASQQPTMQGQARIAAPRHSLSSSSRTSRDGPLLEGSNLAKAFDSNPQDFSKASTSTLPAADIMDFSGLNSPIGSEMSGGKNKSDTETSSTFQIEAPKRQSLFAKVVGKKSPKKRKGRR